jgi:tetratricopeptide (TPR) repeat protein
MLLTSMTSTLWADDLVRKETAAAPNRVLEYYASDVKVATEWDDSANLPISIQGTIPDGTVKQYSGKNDVIEELEFKNGKLNGSAQWDLVGKHEKTAYFQFVDGRPEGHQRIEGEHGLMFEFDITKGVISNISYPSGHFTKKPLRKSWPFFLKYVSYADYDRSSFEKAAADYLPLNKKPALPEDVRKFAVQADEESNEKRYDEAIDSYEKALEIAPWWSKGYYNRAFLLAERKDFGWAVRDMKKYLELEPQASDSRAVQDQIYKWEAEPIKYWSLP